MKTTLFLLFTLRVFFPIALKCQSPDKKDSIAEFKDIGLWVDPIIQKGMESFNIPGVAFVLVSKDSILYSKGYGFANLEGRIPVNPFETHFDMGSIPKALTAVAALQLVEDGIFNLHAPISEVLGALPYCKFEDGRPITLHHLLTHTAGIDDISNIGSASKSIVDFPSLSDFLEANPPKQFTGPGRVVSYSNLGYGLIGRMMEIATDKPYQEYMRSNLLEPLQMEHSSFEVSQIHQMDEQRAVGYEYFDGTYHAVPKNFQINLPAAGLRGSAGDMANFVQMLLNKGKFDGKVILGEGMVDKMTSTQYTSHPDIIGLGYSLREQQICPSRIMAQNGGWQGYNNDFFIFPDKGVGFMVSVNTDDSTQLAEELLSAFKKKFLDPCTDAMEIRHNPADLLPYVGTYRSNRHSRHTITKAGILLGAIPEFEIEVINDSLNYQGVPLIFLGNDVFSRSDGHGKIAFIRNANHQITHMVRDYSPYDANEKIKWFETAQVQLYVFIFILTMQLALLLISIYLTVKRFWFSRVMQISVERLNVIFGNATSLIFVYLLISEFMHIGPWELQYGLSANLRLILLLPYMVLVFLFVSGYFVYKKFRNGNGFFKGILLSLISLTTMAVFLLLLNNWNLIGYQL
ncbi:serine hydrolase domain-containing protein [Flagellimonas meishanensis]|uniref:serine hydrolase domain-containing protein n=1 Tax=Flagellimonas meishanensis TaxID=2873264 RepID=UPI001CA723F9|nr:serine hydrolase domain-containing protein [[Muricauda] meishanensis]